MNPGILLAVLAASRLVAGFSGRGGHGPVKRPARMGWAPLLWFFVPFLAAVAIAASRGRLAVPAVLGAVVLLFPWPVARWILIPLGLGRAAYCVAILSDITWRRDHRGGAALAGAWALLRARRPSVRTAAWIERRLARKKPIRGAGVVGAGLLAAGRGDLENARALLESGLALHGKVSPPAARRVAREWLAADAAARGDWSRVQTLGSGLGPKTRLLRLLARVAARLRGDPWAPGTLGLWVRWGFARRRRHTLALVRRALGVPVDRSGDGERRERRPTEPLPEPPPGAPLDGALHLHANALAREGARLAPGDLVRLGRAWDQALGDRALAARATERAAVLGTPGGAAALARLQSAVAEDLVELVRATRTPLDELGSAGILARVTQAARSQLLSEIELAAEAIRRRVDDKRELPGIDEWREFTALRRSCERAVEMGGLALRRLLFPKVHADACHLAVWLWNIRRERPIANAMFQWLLTEAAAVGNTAMIELEQKNVECGP